MKLSPITIYVIGLAVAVVAIAYGVFYNMVPNNQQASYFRTATEQLNDEAAKMNQAKKKVENAQHDVEVLASKWKGIAAQHTPSGSLATGGINLDVNAFQLTEDTRQFRNSIQRAVNAQVRRGGVTVVNGPLIPFADTTQPGQLLASYFNYASAGFPVVVFNLGTVTVQGTYDQILENVRLYKYMPRYLAVADGLTLSGTSPNLTGTYNLTLVGFIPAATVFGGIPAPDAAPGGATPAGMPGGGMPGAGGPPMGGRPMGGPPMGGRPMGAPPMGGPSTTAPGGIGADTK